ncbi:hypothetical protein [Pseudolabrys sp.]|uniref:hypothetical protein n=1 Tax=Pseudolabrys sp. TaxID=1960880 RepID=UPI003D0C20D8
MSGELGFVWTGRNVILRNTTEGRIEVWKSDTPNLYWAYFYTPGLERKWEGPDNETSSGVGPLEVVSIIKYLEQEYGEFK